MGEPLDILVAGPAEPRPRRRLLVISVTSALLVLIPGAWFVDLREQRAEITALRDCAVAGHEASTAAAAPVDGMAGYVRPTLTFAEPSASDGLYRMVARAAAGAGPALQGARDVCADVDIRPWHDRLQAARSAQLAYLDAALGLLRRTAGDGRVWFDRPPDLPQLHRTAELARDAAAPESPWDVLSGD